MAQAARRLAGGQAQPARKMPAAAKRVNVRHAPEKTRGDDDAHAGHGLQAPRNGIGIGHRAELVVHRREPVLEIADVLEERAERLLQQSGQGLVRVVE